MLHEEEYLLLIQELGRLYEDYHKCDKEDIKQAIYSDILLLSEAIDTPN